MGVNLWGESPLSIGLFPHALVVDLFGRQVGGVVLGVVGVKVHGPGVAAFDAELARQAPFKIRGVDPQQFDAAGNGFSASGEKLDGRFGILGHHAVDALVGQDIAPVRGAKVVRLVGAVAHGAAIILSDRDGCCCSSLLNLKKFVLKSLGCVRQAGTVSHKGRGHVHRQLVSPDPIALCIDCISSRREKPCCRIPDIYSEPLRPEPISRFRTLFDTARSAE